MGTPLDEQMSNDPSTMVNAAVTPPPGNASVALAGDSDDSDDSTRAEMIRKLNGQAHVAAAASKPVATVDDLTPSRAVLELPLHQIDNNPFQPRREFNQEEIASLAESLKEHEQLQPVLVRRVGDRFQLISGERRLRAAIQAGMKTIRAEIRQADDRLVAELAIIENLQRKDLNPIEKALSFKRYVTEHRCTQDDLAKRLKIDRSTIANMMRLLELPDPIQSAIQRDEISAGHARSLLPLGNEKEQLEFAKRAKEEGWSVRRRNVESRKRWLMKMPSKTETMGLPRRHRKSEPRVNIWRL